MKKLLSYPIKIGLLAASVVACMATPLIAGTLPKPQATAPSAGVTLVRDSWAGDPPRTRKWRRHSDNWRHGSWRHGNRHWRHNGWRHRPHHRRHHRNHYRGSGIYFGLGLVPGYNYRVAPRRHYRSGSSAHVRWCYDRYRSYRAWDNTYQPYNGPRRRCRSPYG